MKVFHCDHCDNLVFFESVRCVHCGHTLAYLPDLGVTGSLDPGEGGTWTSPLVRSRGRAYRLCRNYTEHNVCNWAEPAEDASPYCRSCRLTHVVPDLSVPGNTEAWFKLEVAKRRLIYSLLSLRLPLAGRAEEPEGGLAFEFRADPADPALPRVLTGHSDGLITVNVAEADDAEREKRRQGMKEAYRTLLGHFRHEVGHFYWDRLIAGGPHLDGFRDVFGDEQEDYDAALKRYYAGGPGPDWQARCISAYATAHPWEDWAETWAHYLHMTDLLETTADCGLTLRPKRSGEPVLKSRPADRVFDAMIDNWYPLTYVLNNLNRGMGLPDGYPFVLSPPVVEKLRFVHEVVTCHGAQPVAA